MRPRLEVRYRSEIVRDFMEKHGKKNNMHVPVVRKVVVSMGVGEGARDPKVLEQAAVELAQITGQKPLTTYARKSIACFSLREGQPIGLKVTLRRARMYEFMDRLFSVAMPRIRDFRGLGDESFDPEGNYTLGLKEQLIFPEINFDEVRRVQGMNVTFVISGRAREEAKLLLSYLGMPFRKS